MFYWRRFSFSFLPYHSRNTFLKSHSIFFLCAVNFALLDDVNKKNADQPLLSVPFPPEKCTMFQLSGVAVLIIFLRRALTMTH